MNNRRGEWYQYRCISLVSIPGKMEGKFVSKGGIRREIQGIGKSKDGLGKVTKEKKGSKYFHSIQEIIMKGKKVLMLHP